MSNAQLSPRCFTASPLLALLYGLSPIHRSALPIFFGYFAFPPPPHHLFIGFKNLSRFVFFFFHFNCKSLVCPLSYSSVNKSKTKTIRPYPNS